MKCFNLIILSFLLVSCSRQACPGSVSIIRDTYKRHLIILKESKHPKKLVSPKETQDAVYFLGVVSGISSKGEIGDIQSYRTKGDFIKDIKLRSDSYRKNRCKLTLRYVDSSFANVGFNWN